MLVSTRQFKRDVDWVVHTHAVLELIDRAETTVVEVESQKRGYVLTGDDTLRASLDHRETLLREIIARLRDQTADNANQQGHLVQAVRLFSQMQERVDRVVKMRLEGGFQAARDALDLKAHPSAIAAFRDLFATMRDEEMRLLALRSQAAEARARFLIVAQAMAVLLSGAMLAIAFVWLMREFRRRDRAEAVLGNRVRERACVNDLHHLAGERTSPEGFLKEVPSTVQNAMDRSARVAVSVEWDGQGFATPEFETLPGPGCQTGSPVGDGSDIRIAVRWQADDESFDAEGLNQHQRFLDMATRVVAQIVSRLVAEDDLKTHVERLRLATEAAELGVWTWDLKINELTWDNRMYAIYGVTPDECSVAYEAWSNRLDPADLAAAERDLKEALETGGRFESEFRICLPDGSIRYVAASAAVVKDHEDKPVRIVGVNRDITGEAIQEKRMNELVAKLEQSNRDLEQFAYIASHDLQEPLRMVSSFTSMLEKRYHDKLDDKGRQFIAYAVEGAERMRELIEDILAFSRVSSDTREWVDMDLREPLDRALDGLRVAIDEPDAEVTVADLPRVRGVEGELMQVFLNLVGNGIKFRQPGTRPLIDISAEREGGMVAVTVRDNGIGIPEKDHDRVFEIFQRLHRRSEYAGTGIGLALCRKIVERHGGTISLESAPGQGSAFTFTLTAADAPEAEVPGDEAESQNQDAAGNADGER